MYSEKIIFHRFPSKFRLKNDGSQLDCLSRVSRPAFSGGVFGWVGPKRLTLKSYIVWCIIIYLGSLARPFSEFQESGTISDDGERLD